MSLRVDVDGILVQLRIKEYDHSHGAGWDSRWCKCDFSFSSGEWLNYHKEDDEVMLSSEVEELEEALSALLKDEIAVGKEICCLEPDFVFFLQPKRDLRKDSRFTYIKPGYEIADIYVEWKVYFWDAGLTDNFLTVTLGRDEIIQLRDYLAEVIEKSTG